MQISIAHIPVSRDIQENSSKVLSVLDKSQAGKWIIFPEGMISGYYPEDSNYIERLDTNQIEETITQVHELVKSKDTICLIGTAVKRGNDWFNATIILSKHKRLEYYKNNLSNADRAHFKAGNSLPVYELNGITFGVQICRENAFPEQWKVLKKKGAQVVFHINNAVNDYDIVRKYLLIARAFENQYFVVSVNSFTATSTLPSLIVNLNGQLVLETNPNIEEVIGVEIDLDQVRNDYLNQERSDLVSLKY